MSWMLWNALVACTGDPSTDPTTDPSPSGTQSSPIVCAAQPDNVLRVDCAIDLPSAAATVLTYTDPDGASVVLESAAAEHPAYTLWGLRAETTYAVRVDGAGSPLTASFTTGALPEALQALTVDLSGSSSADALVQHVDCDGASYAVVLDTTDGAVRWYELAVPPAADDNEHHVGGGGIFGMSLTDAPGVLALVGFGVREWAFTGAPGVTFDVDPAELMIHHDVARAGDNTLTLFSEPITAPDGQVFVIDGVAVFGPDGTLLTQWHLADHIDPEQLLAGGGPPAQVGPQPADQPVDWSHANGITVTEDGDWIVSFRWLSAVYRIDGHLDAPTFGDVVWVVTGDPASPIPSSFAVDADGRFVGQHHPTLVGDELTVFDNRVRPETSRTVTLRLDPVAGTARTVETHDVGEPCDVEGGAVPLPGGGVFATCATSGIGREFPAGSGDTPSFTIHASCPAAAQAGPTVIGPAPIGRITPLALP